MFIVLFFKQKTAYEMRIIDWSSDVCSSDLLQHHVALADVACLGRPFARAAVEQQADVVRLHPHDADEVMGGVAVDRHGNALAQLRFDMEARRALRRPGGG